MRARSWVLGVMAALWVAAGWSGRAQAYDIVRNDELSLTLFGWGRAGYLVADPVDGDAEWGPYIKLARIGAGATYTDLGGLRLQLEASRGNVTLLDLIAWVEPTPWLQIRAGRYKVPTSAEFLISAPSHPFVNRTLFNDFVPHRAIGVEVVGTAALGAHTLDLQLGLFNPAGVQRLGEDGQLFSARARLAFDFGLQFHVAFADVAGDEGPGSLADTLLTRHIDGAVLYNRDNWWVHAEVVKVLEGVVDVLEGADDREPLGAMLMGGIRFGDDGAPPVFEPVLAWDLVVDEPTGDRTRARAGLNVYFRGQQLRFMVNYELDVLIDGDEAGHAGYVQLQGGL